MEQNKDENKINELLNEEETKESEIPVPEVNEKLKEDEITVPDANIEQEIPKPEKTEKAEDIFSNETNNSKMNDKEDIDFEKLKAEIDAEFDEKPTPSSDLQEEIVLKDNKSYYILDRITYNKEFYLLLVCAEDDDHGTLIQKEVMEDNELKLKPLSSEEEFKEVLKRFSQKDISP